MIPRFKPDIGWHELVASVTPAPRDAVSRFERDFAEAMQQKYAVAFPYGRTGLLLLLQSLGLKDKEIVCPTYTCVVVAHAIVMSGNVPVFVDSGSDFNMDLALVEHAVTARTGAILATSIFGFPIDLDRLQVLRDKFPNVLVIQDCAHSFGAKWKDRLVNQAGIAAIYGLNVSKIMTSVFGGMVTTDSRDVYDALVTLRDRTLVRPSIGKSIARRLYLMAVYFAFIPAVYTFVQFLERHGWLDRFVKYFDAAEISMPADHLQHMLPFEGRIGVIQTKKYQRIIQRRVAIAARYCAALGRQPVAGATYSHFPILVGDRASALQAARDVGAQLGTIVDYSCAKMPLYSRHRYVTVNDLASEFKDHVVNLPMVDVSEDLLATLVRIVKSGRPPS